MAVTHIAEEHNAAEEASADRLLPDLRIIPIGALIPHEEHDAQRSQPLIARIGEAGVWLNPPVVAPIDSERYVILDGANRHYALTALGFPHILVQVVEYESASVQLKTWQHVVGSLSWFELLRHICEIPALRAEAVELLSARAALAQRQALAYIVLQDDSDYLLSAEHPTAPLVERNKLLRAIVDTYKQRGTLNRITTDRLSAARHLYADATAVVVFPNYEPVEIVVAARERAYLPPGITRHLIQGRALRLNYPLEALRRTDITIDQKNAELHRWIQARTAERRIRFYAESTYLFDE